MTALLDGGVLTIVNPDKFIEKLELDLRYLSINVFDGLTKITVGNTPPITPIEGDLWVDTT